jgi:hypothetical protein
MADKIDNPIEKIKTIDLNLSGGVIEVTEAGTYQLVTQQPLVSVPVIIKVNQPTLETRVRMTFILPPSTDGQSPVITIIDVAGNASKLPIVITTYSSVSEENSDLINASSSLTINLDNGLAKTECITTGVWLAIGNYQATAIA